jgi:hypothetical protein
MVTVKVNSQVSEYAFAQSGGVYTPITGGTLLQSTTSTSIDDNTYLDLDIGFSFAYAGTNYTKFSIAANGYIALGSTVATATAPISVGTTNNVISVLGVDLIGRQFISGSTTSGSNIVAVTSGSTIGMSVGDLVTGTGIAVGSTITAIDATTITLSLNATSTGANRNIRSVNVGNIRYELTGTAPNRKLVIQWSKFSRYITNAPSDLLNFQIVLEETTNKISFVYDIPYIFTTTSVTPQIGLRGASNADFNNRKTTTDWSATTAGTTNADNCTFTNVIFPASGQTYTWTPPSCIAPGGITTSLTSTTSATISWNASASATSGYDYYVSTVNTAPTVGTTPTASTTNTTATLSSLTASTTYYYWVRSNCGSGSLSGWASGGSFFTGYCLPSTTAQTSWVSAFSTTGGNTNITYTAASGTAGGYNNQSATISVSNYVGNATNLSMTAGGPTCGFAVWIDWNNNLVFETTERVFNTTGYVTTATGAFTVPTGTANGAYRMRVVTDYNNGNPTNPCLALTRGEYVDFTFNVVSPPSCLPVTGLTTTLTSTTSANFSWTAPNPVPASGYEWEVSTSATAPAAGTNTATATATSTTLLPNTTYYLHVRSACAAGEFSTWTTSSFFTGYCTPASTAQTSWVSAFATTGGNSNITYTAASGTAGGYNNQSANLSASNYIGGTTNLSMTAGGPTCGFAVWIDWNNNLVFETTERVFNTTGYVTTATGSFTVPTGTANGAYRMRVVTDYNNGNPTNPCATITRGEYVDFTFNVVTAPTCFPVTGLTNTQLTLTSATHAWTAPVNGTPVGYEWVVTTSATPPASGTATTNLTETSTGLLTDVTYYLHVRTDCGAGDFSSWATSSFILGYCTPVYTTGTASGDLISNVSIVGTTLSNNTGFVAGTPSYTFYTGQPNYTASLLSSSSYTVNVSTGEWGDQGYAAWIDYNDDGVFDATERIGATNGVIGTGLTTGQVNASSSFNISLACTPPAGVHRLRVRGVYNLSGTSINPCSSYIYGETEDYLITIVAPPTCPAPGAPVAGTAGSFTLDFDFPLNCATATNFDVEYGPVGFTPGTGTVLTNQTAVINGTTGTISLSGLLSTTTYDAYIRSNCGNGDVSTWTVAGSGATLQAPCSGTPNTPVATFLANDSICANDNTIVTVSGLTDNVLNISNQWELSTNNVDWNPLIGETLPTYQSGSLLAGTYYYRHTSTCLVSNETATSNVLTLVVNALPTIGVTAPNNGAFCGTQAITASGAATYTWAPSNLVSSASGTTVTYTGTDNGTLTVTGTDANGCVNTSAPFNITFTAPAPITWVATTPSFCGTGGTTSVAVNSTANYTYGLVNNSTAVITGFTATSFNTTVTETSAFLITGTDPNTGCSAQTTVQINVFALPTANVTSDVSGVCPGSTAIISTGLAAGNFTSTSIPFSPLTAPGDAVSLASGGVALVPQTGGTLDDGGWGNIPVGFNFNFFGTTYSSINVGTNGTVMFGTFNNNGGFVAPYGLSDYGFTSLPSTTEPFNMVAVLAMDNNLNTATGGTIKYWTEGLAPNRRFIVSYENVREFGGSNLSTSQAIFYETIGTIEVHVTSSTNVNQNKLVGVNNGDGTVGVLAYASGTFASATNPIANPFAYRFTPPSNYTVVWSIVEPNGDLTEFDTQTNLFTNDVAPTQTTTYDISYTNQTTGCTNPAGSSQITINVLGNVAPTGVNTVATFTEVCENVNFQLATDYTGSSLGLTYQWQVSTDNGQNFTNIAGQTGLTLTTSQADTAIYRLEIISCGGTPSYSSNVTLNISAPTNCYCTPVYTNGTTAGDLISNVEIVGTTLSNNTGFVSGGPSYTFFTGQPNYTTTLVPSTSYTLNVATGEWGDQGYAAWIDYNDDGIFDATERVGATNGIIGDGFTPGVINDSSSFVIALACTPPAGVHRMRIRGVYNVSGLSIDPCSSYGFGETEDYLITIAPAPTCPNPGLLVAGTTTTTTADLSWTLDCSTATSFDFEYGPAGFTPGTGTTLLDQAATTSFTLTNLTPNTTYDVYYRANCGNGDVSGWSIPVNASTLCAPITLVNPGAQIVCDTLVLPTLAEVTPSNNAGLTLSYRTATNGGGIVLTGAITTTQTVYIHGVAGACSANESFLVTVNNSSTSTTNVTQCSSYTWTNSVNYTASGTYTQTLANAAGCDSVATLNLVITQPTTSTLNETACQTFTLNTQTYTASGTYVQTLTNAAGCDSTLTLNLTIGQPDAVSLTEAACDSYTWNGTTYTTSGVYVETLTNALGCDSVVTLNLTINNTSSSNTVVSECASYLWNGTTYTESGTYTFTAQNAAGCDSTATLVLTIGNNSSTTTAATCGSFTWTNGTTYTASGTYTQTLTNAAGCDSLVTLNLTINPTPTATATDNGNGTGTLVASTGASYQWIDCATNTPITGATSATYVAPINGSYAVIVTNSSNCSATSSCVIVDYIGLEEITVSFNVYPNPTTGAINIAIDQTTANFDVTVEDMNGRAVANFGSLINGNGVYSLDLSNVVTGVYFIKLRNELEERTVRIIKQ